MARGDMRIDEVLKLTPEDISGQKLLIRDPKSGRNKKLYLSLKKLQID